MKKYWILSVLTVLATTSMVSSPLARAADSEDPGHQHDQTRLYRFNFQCTFDNNTPSPLDTPADPASGRMCQATATVYAIVDPNDWMASMQSTRDPINRLAVSCNGRLIYSDGAVLDPSDPRYVTIAGVSGRPAIYVERKDHEHISPEWMSYDALLRGQGWNDQSRGNCQVQAEPADGHSGPGPVIQ